MGDASYPGALANSGPAPPPPPPPPVAGQVPALRINTSSEVGPRRGLQQAQEAYEPPAAIQNAMMTKDKKPFTYTPGMGGKLDLSQIRSPRMARRVAKNASDEGIEGPPKVLEQADSLYGPPQQQPSIYSHPQVAVAVFPQPAQLNLRNSCLPRNSDRPQVRVETSSEQSPTPPTSPTSPTQVTLAKAPTPWMQKQAKPQEELPEWAKRASGRPQEAADGQLATAASPAGPGPSQQAQRFAGQTQARAVQPVERSVPLRIEDRPSVFSAIAEPGQHHQFANSNPHHLSRWGNPVGQSAGYQPGAACIVPDQPQSNQRTMGQQPRNQQAQRGYGQLASQQSEPGPLQSQSFRVLQKITDTYPDQLDGAEQLRKLQLTEDDRCLMSKFKEQVDADNYLHQEEDPRYRGAAIPSRAFRYLQTMTDSADVPAANSTSRPVNSFPKKPNRPTSTFVEVPAQPYIPASQQQVQEPKKYTGGAIPSRSFRILQQMTTPESIGCPWRYDSSTTALPSEAQLEGQLAESEEKHNSSCSDDDDDDDDDDELEQEQTDGKREEDADSSDSSCDSESYLAYSTGLNPQSRNRREEEADDDDDETTISQLETREDDSGDSTDCDKASQLEDDKCEVTVSVSLPLRFKSPSVADRDETKESTSEDVVETCVDFTLKRVRGSREAAEGKNAEPPRFVVTAPAVDEAAARRPESLRAVVASKEEETRHDEGSGVCAAADDAEPERQRRPTRQLGRGCKQYERAQTHSRLLKLLGDEQLRADATTDEQRLSDYGRRRNVRDRDDSYYATWKEPRTRVAPLVHPRLNVLCPRTSSAKHIPRVVSLPRSECYSPLRQSCTRDSPLTGRYSSTPITLNRHC